VRVARLSRAPTLDSATWLDFEPGGDPSRLVRDDANRRRPSLITFPLHPDDARAGANSGELDGRFPNGSTVDENRGTTRIRRDHERSHELRPLC
jgi:hypothetical protein